MLSEIKRRRINGSLSRGLFIDKKGRLRYKIRRQKITYEKIIGKYSSDTLTQAKTALAKLLDELRLKRLGLSLPEEYFTVQQAVELVWKHHASKKPINYAHKYRRSLNRIVQFFGPARFIHSITVAECQDFRRWCAKRRTRLGNRITPSTVNRDHTILIALFNALDRYQAEGIIDKNIVLHKRNPAHYVEKAAKTTNPTKPPTQEQYRSLLVNATDDGVRRIILGAAIMMRRKKELMEMNMTMVNEIAGVIRGRISKGRTSDQDRFYMVPISPIVKMLIDTRRSNYIFNFANWAKRWDQTVKRAQLKGIIQFRSLRKFGATQANLLGTDPRTIQEMLGHSSLQMTQIYVQAIPKAIREAAKALDRKLGVHRIKVVNEDDSPLTLMRQKLKIQREKFLPYSNGNGPS